MFGSNRKRVVNCGLLAVIIVGLTAGVAGCDLTQSIGRSGGSSTSTAAGRFLPNDLLFAIDVDEGVDDGMGMGWPPE
ncbi:MAG: hypothetical protein GY778_07300 [bacterium]|nr:hypothetical protein [bacterium]